MKKCKRAIIIFLKYPVSGKVKTRLATTIGNDAAAALYKKMVEHVVVISQKIEQVKCVYYLDEKCFFYECKSWLGPDKDIRIQQYGNIGERMKSAFNCMFTEKYDNVLLVGTDIPSLTSEIINQAFIELEKQDSVLGETKDGGYYLIGLKSSCDILFNNMPWSTNKVFSETYLRVKKMNMTCGLLPVLRDIDTLEDLKVEGFGDYSRSE